MTSKLSDELMKQDAAMVGGLTEQLGQTGLIRFSGHVNEEFLTRLRDSRGRQIYTEMGSNDPIIGSMLYAIEMLLRQVPWTIKPFDDSDDPSDIGNAAFVEEVFDDMTHNMASFIGEWMAAPQYGFAPFEIVWKHRQGFNRNSDLNSKFTDGKLGIADLEIRHPTSLVKWIFDDDGNVEAMEQRSPPTFETVILPAEKMLFFTVLQRKQNPEGMSLLRRAFVPWYRKKRIEEIEGIGIERELAGVPVMKTPPAWWLSTATDDEQNLLALAKKIVKRLRTDEQEGVVMPRIVDSEGNELFTLELMTAGGSRSIETGPPKEYYSRQMAMTILADVILIGHESVGSFALASSKTNLFGAGLGALLDNIEEVFNRELIPRIMTLNGLDPARSPTINHGDIETPDLKVLGDYFKRLSDSGMQLFPSKDGELERFTLRAAGAPESLADDAPAAFNEAAEARERLAQQIDEGSGHLDDEGADE